MRGIDRPNGRKFNTLVDRGVLTKFGKDTATYL